MKNFYLRRGFLLAAIGFSLSSEALAVNPEVANIGYWYQDEDIRGVLKNRLGDGSYIAPAVHNADDLIRDVAGAAIGEALAGKPALIPVNLGNNHWTALAIRRRADGALVVFYNDSFGSSAGSDGSESGKYLAAIRERLPNAEIIDLQVRQQSDGSSCGAFTAENLIALAGLPADELNAVAARSVLEKINDAKAIRLLHLNSLGALYERLVSLEEKASSKILHEVAGRQGEVILSNLGQVEKITNDRIGRLYFLNEISGFSGGDDADLYGVWVNRVGTRGRYKDGGKSSSGVSSFGFDGKIDEETTLGIAISTGQGSFRDKSTGEKTSTKVSIGSLYGSFVLDDGLLISGDVSGGSFVSKNSFKSITGSSSSLKLKGSITGAGGELSYYMGSDIIFVPSLGVSWNETKFAKSKTASLAIEKFSITRVSFNPGFRVACLWNFGAFDFIPEIFGRVLWAGKRCAKEMIVRNNLGMIVTQTKPKIEELRKEAGVSFTLAGRFLELSAGLEGGWFGRNQDRTGFIKLRVNV